MLVEETNEKEEEDESRQYSLKKNHQSVKTLSNGTETQNFYIVKNKGQTKNSNQFKAYAPTNHIPSRRIMYYAL